MRLITLSIALSMWALALTNSYAQETSSKEEISKEKFATEQIEKLQQARQNYIETEKEDLLKKVESVNKKVENNQITAAEGEDLKTAAAEKAALNIENKTAVIDNEIEYVKRNGYVEKANYGTRIVLGIGQEDTDNDRVYGVKIQSSDEMKRRQELKNRRTINEFVLAFGLNNVIIENQSLNDSPYKVGGSKFFEIGTSWKTRVFENSNWLRFKYGISLQFNGLKIDDNQYLVDTGSQTELQEFPANLDKAKFRMDNLVVPIHFEFGPSNKVEKDGITRFNTYNKVKIGFGGYAGLNLTTRQKLKFEDDGEDVKQKRKADYNTNNFIYGLSAYVGFDNTSLYIKYDLNTIFKDNLIDQRNISLGVRFDVD